MVLVEFIGLSSTPSQFRPPMQFERLDDALAFLRQQPPDVQRAAYLTHEGAVIAYRNFPAT